MSKVYVVYEDWGDNAPEIIGVYEDEQAAYAEREIQHEARCKEGFYPEEDFEVCVDAVEMTRVAKEDGELRKVLFTNMIDGRSKIYITDARKSDIEEFCRAYNKALAQDKDLKFYSEQCTYYTLQLCDSSFDGEENIPVIGFDEHYNLADYIEESMAHKLYNISSDMDYADFAEHKSDEIACIEKELILLKEHHCDSLLQALEIIVSKYGG